jgi:hypothetical protein
MSEVDRQLAEAWFRKAENDLLSARNNLAANEVPLDMEEPTLPESEEALEAALAIKSAVLSALEVAPP